MIKALKLQKAVVIIVLGLVALILTQLFHFESIKMYKTLLGISGALLIIGALLFLYPILFAKKLDSEGKVVELEVGSETDEVTTGK